MIAQIAIAPLVALVAGILILIAPRLLNYIVALYLIIIGVTDCFPISSRETARRSIFQR